MTTMQEVIDQNNAATNNVVRTPGPINHYAAELILRNTAVAADRLTPRQASELSEPAAEALLYAATAAQQLAPLEEADLDKLPHETDTQHDYRVHVSQPLHRLQSKLSIGEFDTDDHTTMKLKAAVLLGSVAFERVLSDPAAQSFTGLQNSINYFAGNASAATPIIR